MKRVKRNEWKKVKNVNICAVEGEGEKGKASTIKVDFQVAAVKKPLISVNITVTSLYVCAINLLSSSISRFAIDIGKRLDNKLHFPSCCNSSCSVFLCMIPF